MAYTTKNQKLALVYGDLTLGVHGSDFDYIFSYQTGGLESLVRGKKEWLYRSPRPTFWRATTDNDRAMAFLTVPACGLPPISLCALRMYRLPSTIRKFHSLLPRKTTVFAKMKQQIVCS